MVSNERSDHAEGPAQADTAAHPEPATGPTEQEVDEWAQRERARRQAWLDGPGEDERATWAREERARRRAELRLQARASELARLGRHYGREGQLATEGALSIVLGWTRRTLDDLVKAGREWEAGTTKSQRRVPLDDEDD